MSGFPKIFSKPEYVYRPWRILWRLSYGFRIKFAKGDTSLRLPWGVCLQTNPRETIGKSLCTFGVYELAVSELIWRLVDAGDACLDVGANIGYMTSVMAARAGSKGMVKSFEPHPAVFQKLQGNVSAWTSAKTDRKTALVEVNQAALGREQAEMFLSEPEGFSSNEGTASLSREGTNGHRVQVRRLDAEPIPPSGYGLMKVDVEGAELEVFLGASGLLSHGQIRDIVYEDFAPYPSPSAQMLLEHGYTLFRLNKQLRGPRLWDPLDPQSVSSSLRWEPANYLATLDPTRALERMQTHGWKCLQRRA